MSQMIIKKLMNINRRKSNCDSFWEKTFFSINFCTKKLTNEIGRLNTRDEEITKGDELLHESYREIIFSSAF